ncbi:DUF317 domain-containing protein [Streptomyces hebeiensis]|uniref:DUF317 domain-containing protein n=1 Tax=Streptomyces hebeiensis TaxID=229486 RepID=UPI0031DD860A
MPVTKQQLARFADDQHAQLLFDTQPRYLAGPGDPRHVTHALSAAGWTNLSDLASSQVHLTSPDHRHHLALTPTPSTSATWWRIGTAPFSGPDNWHITFGGMAPVEIVAGLTDALIRPAPDDPPGIWHTLTAAGWTRTEDQPCTGTGRAVSPDQLMRVEQHTMDGRSYWRAEAAQHFESGRVEPIWHAFTDDRIPQHLLSGLATALTNPAPVIRRHFDHTGHPNVSQEHSSWTAKNVVEAHITRLDEIRAQAHTTRRRRKLSAQPASAVVRPSATPAARSR